MVKKEEHWSQKYWRPAMAWQYFTICLFDFMFAPIMLAIYAAIRNIPLDAWHPITLEGGGMYHMAMGAILGITAWTRGKVQIDSVKTSTQPD
jgi:hypothetical protein